jgi:ABC-type glycerol-3-phosphate transport system substrate-binding protein
MFKMFRCKALPLSLLAIFLIGCSAKPVGKGAVTITVWHWMTDRENAFQELARRYQAQTQVKVDFQLYAPSDAYSQKVRAAAQGATLPDIFGVLGEKRDFASFIKAGHILGLSPYMDADAGAWRKSFFSQALAVNEFRAGNSYGIPVGIYAVPIDVMTMQMLYNKDLFKALGLDPEQPPQGFAELLDIGKRIKAAKTQGLVSGWGETWMIEALANNYAFNLMGEDKFLATIRGEVPYTDADWIRVLDLFRQMRDCGVLADGVVTMINKTAERLFANQRAVFAFNGPWCVNVYAKMNPGLNYAVMLPPRASDKYPLLVWGGAGSSFMVNARSKNKEEAVKFLHWLTAKEQQSYLAEATYNLPANKESMEKIPPLLAQFAAALEHSTHPNIWAVNEFPLAIEAFDKGIQSIIIGEKTPEQVASEVQEIKEREVAKKRQ